ncbi:hypothetical protein [Nocardiopsis sp. B62]|uniref:hypothetical protein n=1 Tax=Nocardiopsis sp. B62 TaxID=2824874 RepID=UPI001B379D79|nr:hypothetical protein [Nocardiopsis sp. B62]MBQ1081570.1 hypothetical protein [Nocardiopsis sp. B62]
MIAVVRSFDETQGVKVYEAQDAKELKKLLLWFVASDKDEKKTIENEMPDTDDFYTVRPIGVGEKMVTVEQGFVTRIVSATHNIDARVEDLDERTE